MGQQPGEELLPEVAPPPLMTPDVEVKGILGSHGNEEDDSLYSPLLCQSVFPPLSCVVIPLHLSVIEASFNLSFSFAFFLLFVNITCFYFCTSFILKSS